MSKPLTHTFCFVFALHASLLAAGCGDPLFASFVVRQDEDSTGQRDAARVAADGDSEAKTGRGDGAVPLATGLTPQGCFVLPDLSIISNVDSGLVVAREAASQGCGAPDGGGATSAGTTYTRRDGLPLVQQGELYSFRWGSETIMTHVRLLGGAKICSVDPMVFSEMGIALTPALVPNTCLEFRAPQTAPYLRLYGYGHDFYSLAVINANVVFALCPGSCPPNTQAVDAAVPATVATDAGSPFVPSK